MEPFALRWSCWSLRSGMVWRMRLARSCFPGRRMRVCLVGEQMETVGSYAGPQALVVIKEWDQLRIVAALARADDPVEPQNGASGIAGVVQMDVTRVTENDRYWLPGEDPVEGTLSVVHRSVSPPRPVAGSRSVYGARCPAGQVRQLSGASRDVKVSCDVQCGESDSLGRARPCPVCLRSDRPAGRVTQLLGRLLPVGCGWNNRGTWGLCRSGCQVPGEHGHRAASRRGNPRRCGAARHDRRSRWPAP